MSGPTSNSSTSRQTSILMSFNPLLKNALQQRWPEIKVTEAADMDGLLENWSGLYVDLLILDIDMAEKETLKLLIAKIAKHTPVALFSGKSNDVALAKELILAGARTFLSSAASNSENLEKIKYLLY